MLQVYKLKEKRVRVCCGERIRFALQMPDSDFRFCLIFSENILKPHLCNALAEKLESQT